MEGHRKSEKDFTRTRALPFPHLICFMLNIVNGSIQSELNRFFQVIQKEHVTFNNVTAAAFCKARKKFSHTAFKSLNEVLVKTFYQTDYVKHWNGLRLLAVDGSVTTLPNSPELMRHFGKAREHSNRPATRVSQLYDVINNITVDLQVGLHSTGERDLAVNHLEFCRQGDLILYDRGYPANWFFKLHQHKSIDYCARVPVKSTNMIKNFVKSGHLDLIVDFPCIEKSLVKCRLLGLPTTPIKLRLVKVLLQGRKFEVLITSLIDQKRFPYNEFKALYGRRWNVEEDYKLMKSRLDIENFSGLSVEAIKQDIHAKVLTKNLGAVAIIEANVLVEEQYGHREKQYKINTTFVLSQLKDNVIRFIMRIEKIDLIEVFILAISKVVNAVRPDRKSYRNKAKVRQYKYPRAYKRIG